MIASDKRHLDVVKTLIAAGANVNHSDKVSINTCIYSVVVYTCTCTCTHFTLVLQARIYTFT